MTIKKLPQPRNLQDWDGLPVQYTGWLDRWKDNNYLMRDVSIRAWGEESRDFDHLWFTFDRRPSEQLERLTQYSGCGRVEAYWRTNGSRDYGIQTWIGLDFFKCMEEAARYYNSGKFRHALPRLEKVFAEAQARRLIVPYGYDVMAVEAELSDLIERTKAQIEINERYALRAALQSGERPNPNILNFRSKRQTQARAGFASPIPKHSLV